MPRPPFTATPLLLPSQRCRPRILIVTDGGLNFLPASGFGLSRFIEAVTAPPGGGLVPATVRLAHRQAHAASVTIAGTAYPVTSNYVFGTTAPLLTINDFDQLWMFGVQSSTGALSNSEIQAIANFMNAGGGVFATGDHATLGAAMCSRLPRVRRMRNWATVPMGGEPVPQALDRIDTVVDPGADQQYAFDDQSDNIPQRIYPNYEVTAPPGSPGGVWTASLHPILRMPGSPVTISPQNGGPSVTTGFSTHVDVLPDHPHESECLTFSGNATYTEAGMNFAEWPDTSTAADVPARIAAFSVSGGRSVLNGVWKPPVRPRMFGAISTWDGHLAVSYPSNAMRPGRIVCDATWHHFVNINLDGTGSGRTGLGTGSGAGFVPSAALLKIYRYFNNTLSWLQPSGRIWCWIWTQLVDVIRQPLIQEELLLVPGTEAISGKSLPPRWIGAMIVNEIDAALGAGTAREALVAAVRADTKDTFALLGLMEDQTQSGAFDPVETTIDAWGSAVAAVLRDQKEVNPDELLKRNAEDRFHSRMEQLAGNGLLRGAADSILAQSAALQTRAKQTSRTVERLGLKARLDAAPQ